MSHYIDYALYAVLVPMVQSPLPQFRLILLYETGNTDGGPYVHQSVMGSRLVNVVLLCQVSKPEGGEASFILLLEDHALGPQVPGGPDQIYDVETGAEIGVFPFKGIIEISVECASYAFVIETDGVVSSGDGARLHHLLHQLSYHISFIDTCFVHLLWRDSCNHAAGRHRKVVGRELGI